MNIDDISTDEVMALADQVQDAVEAWTVRARDLLGLAPRELPVPEARFNLRGHMAGQAVMARVRGRGDVLRINVRLLITHTREMLDVTVPHEVAHVAVHHCYGSKVRPHGREWRALMHAFGVSAETCHNMPTQPARQLRRFRYICGCDEPAWLTSIRHNRALKGTVYRCKRCGQRLLPA